MKKRFLGVIIAMIMAIGLVPGLLSRQMRQQRPMQVAA
jgi:hypothetical protein